MLHWSPEPYHLANLVEKLNMASNVLLEEVRKLPFFRYVFLALTASWCIYVAFQVVARFHGVGIFARKVTWVLSTVIIVDYGSTQQTAQLYTTSSAFLGSGGGYMFLFFSTIAEFLQLGHIFVVPSKHFPPVSVTHVKIYLHQYPAPAYCAHFITGAKIHLSFVDAAWGDIVCHLFLMQSISLLMQTQQKCNKN